MRRREPSDLQIEREEILLTIRRSRGRTLRLSYLVAQNGAGKRIDWYSIAELYTAPGGTLRPTTKRFTLRHVELEEVGRTLLFAAERAA